MQTQALESTSGGRELNSLVEVESPDSLPVDSTTRPERDRDREQAIREMAYELYKARGFIDGNDFDDWVKAEARVQQMQSESLPVSAQ